MEKIPVTDKKEKNHYFSMWFWEIQACELKDNNSFPWVKLRPKKLS